VVPLRLGGLRGKKITPSVGWEVPVSILGSASRIGNAAEAASSTRASSRREKGNGMVLTCM
jgi:hypothetical protein